ncbi:MAG TPA: UxaA family hydrolase [Acetobacteraceae bacterium]|nr:UxaA family hydrolase [Acetobacteraceae bacterium]
MHERDTVLIARQALPAGAIVLVEGTEVVLPAGLPLGHKLARMDMAPGDAVTKYGAPIGYATIPIACGEHVHLHNVRSGYTPSVALQALV